MLRVLECVQHRDRQSVSRRWQRSSDVTSGFNELLLLSTVTLATLLARRDRGDAAATAYVIQNFPDSHLLAADVSPDATLYVWYGTAGTCAGLVHASGRSEDGHDMRALGEPTLHIPIHNSPANCIVICRRMRGAAPPGLHSTSSSGAGKGGSTRAACE